MSGVGLAADVGSEVGLIVGVNVTVAVGSSKRECQKLCVNPYLGSSNLSGLQSVSPPG